MDIQSYVCLNLALAGCVWPFPWRIMCFTVVTPFYPEAYLFAQLQHPESVLVAGAIDSRIF